MLAEHGYSAAEIAALVAFGRGARWGALRSLRLTVRLQLGPAGGIS
jgi:hypothetical protein